MTDDGVGEVHSEMRQLHFRLVELEEDRDTLVQVMSAIVTGNRDLAPDARERLLRAWARIRDSKVKQDVKDEEQEPATAEPAE